MSWRRNTGGPFSRALADHLGRQRRSQADLARRAGIDPSFVSRLLSGDRGPDRPTVTALASALHLDAGARADLMLAAGFVPDGMGEDVRLLASLPDPVRVLVRELMMAMADGPYGKERAA